VAFVAAADGTAAHKKPTATGQMRKVNIGWFLERYEDDGAEEWPRLPGRRLQEQRPRLLARRPGLRGQWRYRGRRGGGGDERGCGDSGCGGGGNGDDPENESGKEESGDEPEDGDSSDEDEDKDEDGDDGSYDGSDVWGLVGLAEAP